MLRIRRNDTVQVITGRDKGKRGKVIDINFDKGLIKVDGIALVTKHQKARRQGETSAIKKKESYINISNVMLVSSTDSQPCRVGFKVQDDGTKVRIDRRTKNEL